LGGVEPKIFTASKPVEVCQSDALGERFDAGFRAARAAGASGAAGVRLRRRCKDGYHDQRNRRVESNLALESRRCVDDGDNQPVECECSGGWFSTIYSDGDREFEYKCDLERERDGRRVGRAGDDFCKRQLRGTGDTAESGFVDDHSDERGSDFGERVERGDDFESDADPGGRESGKHGDGQLFDHLDGNEFCFGRAGDAKRHGADDDICFFDAAFGERE
jgi:hypothetical protein